MIIEKTKRKGVTCQGCLHPINSKYRAIYDRYYYHIKCIYDKLEWNLKRIKRDLKELSKTKYKKQMIMDGLQ